MKRAAGFVLGMVLAMAAQAIELKDIFPSDVCAELVQNETVSHLHYNEDSYTLNLRPNTELAERTVGSWTSAEKPIFVIEKLFLFNKQKFLANTGKTDISISDVSQCIRAFSTMKGQQYYSNTRKRVETLYVDAYTFDVANKSKAIADRTAGSADGLELYCMNEDHSLGKCFYKVNFMQTENELSAQFTNIEPIKYGPITAVKPGNLQITIDVVDCGDDVVVFMFFEAKFPNIAVFASKLTKSFTARVDAMYNWFTDQLIK